MTASKHPGFVFFAFPGAQVSFAPIEETMNGRAIIHGGISPPIGRLTQPVETTFEKGEIVDFKGQTDAVQWKEWLVSQEDSKMFPIAHVSVGLNPNAELRGFIIEDERVKGNSPSRADPLSHHFNLTCTLRIPF